MTIFQKSVEQTTREYKVTTVVVSLITYLVALLSIIAVNWAATKHHILKWRKFGHEKTPVKANLHAAPKPAQPAGPAPTSQEPKTGDTEEKSGPRGELQDIESASNGADKRSKFWSRWRK